MNTLQLLTHLDHVKQLGRQQWKACCPAHDDKNPSLSIRETEDGKTLLRCWAGCSTYEIISALGFSMSDLFSERIGQGAPHVMPHKPRLDGWAILEALSHEALVIAVAGEDISQNMPLSTEDLARVKQAVERIQRAVGEANAIR